MRSAPKKTICVLLPLSLCEEIDRLAAAQNRTRSGCIRHILREYFRIKNVGGS